MFRKVFLFVLALPFSPVSPAAESPTVRVVPFPSFESSPCALFSGVRKGVRSNRMLRNGACALELRTPVGKALREACGKKSSFCLGSEHGAGNR